MKSIIFRDRSALGASFFGLALHPGQLMFLVGDCVFALYSEVSVLLSFKDLIEDFVALLQDLFLACQHPVHLEVPHDFLLAWDEWVKRF